MCDILDTISLNRLFQLKIHGHWEPYKGILAKSLNFEPNVRLFRARKCGFWYDAPSLSESPNFSADLIGRLPKYDSSNSSKSYPYKQYSKGPKIIRRVLSKEL